MGNEAAIGAIRERLEAIENLADASEVEAWRNETRGVLRGVFKLSHPSIVELDQVRFLGPMGIDMFASGKSEAAGLLRGLVRELELSSAR